MRNQPIGQFLGQLAARMPAPGGGAVAALHAAQAAALLSMVARYSDGPDYAAHEALIGRIRDTADRARDEALRLAAADAAAFGAVTESYRLPTQTPSEQHSRSEAIASALAGAAQPPAEVVALATGLVELAEELLPVANPNVLPDVAAAAEAVRAAATTARVNVEVNLAGITDDVTRVRLATEVALVDSLAARAEGITAAVRVRIGG